MFSKTDFWIGLAVGAVAGVFGYRFMQEHSQQMAALEAGHAELSLAELQRLQQSSKRSGTEGCCACSRTALF